MEEELKRLSKSLGGFCNHLQTSCDAFNLSLNRRPIPLDSASSTFIKSLNRRISTTGSELSFLDSLTFGTVSFEELLGHCNQIYRNNQDQILQLEDRLVEFGYVNHEVVVEEESDDGEFGHGYENHFVHSDGDDDEEPPQRSIIKGLDEDDLLDDSLNLKNLGLSDACLATLASNGNDNVNSPVAFLEESVKSKPFNTSALPVLRESQLLNEDEYVSLEVMMDRTSAPTITLIKEEYESLPSYMKCLASWEDLLGAVDKFNLNLSSKKETNGSYYFRADEIPTLGLGHKEKAYMVLLSRMKRLVVETVDGVVSYKVA